MIRQSRVTGHAWEPGPKTHARAPEGHAVTLRTKVRSRPKREAATDALRATVLAILLVAAGCSSGDGPTDPEPDPTPGEGLVLTEVASGLNRPLALESPPADPRLFVVQQSGEIRIIRDGSLLDAPFLDLGDRTRAEGERGLLGLAFHPDFASNGRFFVNYTDLSGTTRIEEFAVGAAPDAADPDSGVSLLTVAQPFSNHNGGHLAFGPDGMLYVGLGDGGSGGDPAGNGQNVQTLLGGLLRLDVAVPGEALIPPDNPFAGEPATGREELWAWGLRNPWRFSFDPEGGDLCIADVGQNSREEVNVVSADRAGVNYGWNVMEGRECFGASSCDQTGLELPVLTYVSGAEGCAVVGGYVYRGDAMPDLDGTYFYSDYCSGWLRSFRVEDGEAAERTEWNVPNVGRILSMGRDADGELYLLTQSGRVYRLEPEEE